MPPHPPLPEEARPDLVDPPPEADDVGPRLPTDPAPDLGEEEPRRERVRRRASALERLERRITHASGESWIAFGIVAACVVFTFVQLQPELIFRATTPNGGDMGAHVWAPAYLRDHLLPSWQLTGWTQDWYAGFPALRFYMVPPMLAIVALDLVAPYGVAFKLVTVAGVLALPVAAWAFGRLAALRFPVPPLLAAASVLFLFERDFSIYGGNIPSTLAGEFSFSISLALAVLYVGLVANGLRTGRHRVSAAVVVALCALTHVIPLIFAVAATAVLLAVNPTVRGLRWVATTGPVGALVAMWWLLPFWGLRSHLNDMGWEKLLPPEDAAFWERTGFWLTNVFPREHAWTASAGPLGPDVRLDLVVVVLAGIFVTVSRRSRIGSFLVAMIAIGGVAVVLLPQGRLWNARLLPFTHLLTYLLVALAAGELIRVLAAKVDAAWREPTRIALAVLAFVAALFAVALPLRALPFFGEVRDDGTYAWLGIESETSYIPGWARWNYRGYEGKGEAWLEYDDVVTTMGNVGERLGCGRAMWEYEKDPLDAYGTPMALMLLPYWTDGCIGSMEGLYFESSITTPFHFLNQSSLSTAPSRAQRDLPYRDFDVELGVDQLQMLGVRYYMARTERAISAASGHGDLTEVARSGPWVIYEVAGSELVEPLERAPVVIDDAPDGYGEWLELTADWFQDPSQWDLHLAAGGPDEWERVGEEWVESDGESLPEVEVSNIEVGDDRIVFDVSEPGVPVLVKVSHFPNWQASGAEGPWMVSPSLMVVVPTDTHVELTYGWSHYEVAGWGLSALGVVGLVLLVRAGSQRVRTSPRPGPHLPV